MPSKLTVGPSLQNKLSFVPARFNLYNGWPGFTLAFATRAIVMNYHIENLQGQRNTADGMLALLKELVRKIAPEQYHIDGAAEDIKKAEDKSEAQTKHIKLLTEQLDEADITVETTGYEEAIK